MTEPLLETIEDNPVHRWWDRPPARRAASPYDGIFMLFLGMGLLLAAVDPMPGVAWLFLLLVAKMLVESFREPTGSSVVAGRTLREWADLAKTGVAPRDVAVGLWALRARGFRIDPPTARAVLVGMFGLVFLSRPMNDDRIGGGGLAGALFGHLDAAAPWIGPISGVVAYLFARAWRNPWSALPRARAAFRGIPPAFSDEEAKSYTLLLREDFVPTGRKRLPGSALDEFAAVGCLVPFVVYVVVGAILEVSAIGTPELRDQALRGFVGACMGGLLGRFDARADRLAAEMRLLQLATEVRGTMRLACRVVHGSDATIPGAPFEAAMDRARRALEADSPGVEPRLAPFDGPGR